MSLDTWREVLDVLGRSKLRTSLTALSVAWGIFMLVLLTAAGNGLAHSVEYDFRDDATNSIWVRQGKTSLPFGGHAPGRPVNFELADIDAIRREVSGVEYMSGRFFVWGGLPVSHGTQTASFEIRGCHPDHQYLERTMIRQGRFIDDIDVQDRRKVAVIGTAVKQALFGKDDAIGDVINIRGANYRVVGVFEDPGGEGELRRIYIPITTAELVYHGGSRVHQIMYTTGTASVAESEAMVRRTREVLAERHHFDPDDRRAVMVSNNQARFQKLMGVIDWVRAFVWVVGIGTLVAGVVGVSNVMLISVQERTLEIGIRKAIGATPGSIVTMILTEALLITGVSGYAGLCTGVGLVEAVRRNLPPNDYIRNPDVDVRVAIGATLLLVLLGALAGLLPALRAARVRPIVAMRDASA